MRKKGGNETRNNGTQNELLRVRKANNAMKRRIYEV